MADDLVLRLSAQTGMFSRNLKGARKDLADFERGTQKTSKSLQAFNNMMNKGMPASLMNAKGGGKSLTAFNSFFAPQQIAQVAPAMDKAKAATVAYGSTSRQLAFQLQQLSFGFQDFVTVLGTQGVAGALRSTSNNLGQVFTIMGPMTGAIGGLAVGIGTALLPLLDRMLDRFGDLRETIKANEQALSRLTGVASAKAGSFRFGLGVEEMVRKADAGGLVSRRSAIERQQQEERIRIAANERFRVDAARNALRRLDPEDRAVLGFNLLRQQQGKDKMSRWRARVAMSDAVFFRGENAFGGRKSSLGTFDAAMGGLNPKRLDNIMSLLDDDAREVVSGGLKPFNEALRKSRTEMAVMEDKLKQINNRLPEARRTGGGGVPFGMGAGIFSAIQLAKDQARAKAFEEDMKSVSQRFKNLDKASPVSGVGPSGAIAGSKQAMDIIIRAAMGSREDIAKQQLKELQEFNRFNEEMRLINRRIADNANAVIFKDIE